MKEQAAEDGANEGQDGAQKEEKELEATEFGRSEQAFEVKMLKEMNRTD